jgi:myo-inositol-1(or 4)-monophosphatase
VEPKSEQTEQTPSPAVLASMAVRLAAGAAKEVLASRGSADSTTLKIDSKSTLTDLVTATDRASERWLVEQILAARPDDGVVGEEGASREGTTGVRWILDPIDGTVNFVLGLPNYAVSVAAELDGIVVAGAVCNVVTGEVFHARSGGGAFLGDEPLHGPRGVPLARAVIGTGFGYEAARRTRQVAIVAQLLGQIADLRRMGAASLDLCAVAAGRLDGYFEAGLNIWDYAAGALIALEAGCVVGGLRGQGPSSEMTVAAGQSLAAELVALLESLDADRLT